MNEMFHLVSVWDVLLCDLKNPTPFQLLKHLSCISFAGGDIQHAQNKYYDSFSKFYKTRLCAYDCPMSDLPVEKLGECQVRVVYFWAAVDVCLLWTAVD